jgi:hypothetical protein
MGDGERVPGVLDLLALATLARDPQVCGEGVQALVADVGARDADAELAERGDQHEHARSRRSDRGLAGDEPTIDADSYAVDLLLRELRHVPHRTARGGRVRIHYFQLAVSEEPPQETPEVAT